MESNAVYEEWESRLVPAPGHGPNIHYRVFLGLVNWNRTESDDLHRAFVTFMQYGDQKDWKEACRLGQIAFKNPPHVTSMEEMLAISEAVDELAEKYKV